MLDKRERIKHMDEPILRPNVTGDCMFLQAIVYPWATPVGRKLWLSVDFAAITNLIRWGAEDRLDERPMLVDHVFG